MPNTTTHSPAPPSPLLLCDRLIALAQEADRAGFAITAGHLAELAESMFEEQPRRPATRRATARTPRASG